MRRAPSTVRRRLSGVVALSAIALGGVALLEPAFADAPAQRPSVFAGTAVAAAVHEEENGQAGFAVYEPFYGSFADGLTTYSTNGVSARASTFWPGPTVGDPASFICQLNCISVPAYPLSVETEGNPPSVSQETPGSVGGTGQPASALAASADATANVTTGVSSDAVAGGFSSPGGGSPATTTGATAISTTEARQAIARRVATASARFHQQVSFLLHPSVSDTGAAAGGSIHGQAAPASTAVVTVQSMTSSTSQHFDGSTLLVSAETELSGVSLLGGVIQIGSIQTTSTATGNGGSVHTHSDHVTISGVTVGGVPATIDQNGVTVDGQGTGSAVLQSLNADLQQALAASGAEVTVVGTTANPPQPLGGCGANASSPDQADGVFVHTSANLQSVPVAGDIYNGDYTLGSTCASLIASNPGGTSSAAASTGVGAAGSGAVSGPTPGASATGGAESVPASGIVPSATGGPGLRTSPTSSQPPSAAASTSGSDQLAGVLVSRRFSNLYLAVVLAFCALLIGAGTGLPTSGRRDASRRSGQ